MNILDYIRYPDFKYDILSIIWGRIFSINWFIGNIGMKGREVFGAREIENVAIKKLLQNSREIWGIRE